MKRNALLLLANAALWMAPTAFAQNSAFTYQGKLDDGGHPATGLYEMTFALHATAENGTAMATTTPPMLTPVTNGLFTAVLNFGSTHFNGSPRWMQVSVRSNGVATPAVPLLPRTALGSAPHATYAEKAGSVASGSAVKSLNNLKDDVVLAAGNNVTLNTSGNTITVASTGGAFSLNGASAYYNGGNVGIGTINPQTKLHLYGPGPVLRMESTRNDDWAETQYRTDARIWHTGVGGSATAGGGDSKYFIYDATAGQVRMLLDTSGNVGFGTTTPMEKLHVAGGFLRVDGYGGEQAYLGGDGAGGDVQIGSFNPAINNLVAYNARNNTLMDFVARDITAGGDVHTAGSAHGMGHRNSYAGSHIDGPVIYGYNAGGLGTSLPDELSLSWDWNGNVWVRNNLSTCSLTIRGGCDLAEPFQMSEPNIPKGAIVVIDEQQEGRLKMSAQAYDTRVAGVVSGANGINPGISLTQAGVLDQGENVALTGRVYAQADAGNGSIKPGDLLTTSDVPGHLMKVTDHTRAPGAVVGKAMSSLESGQGLVLVLVNLQ